MSPNPLHTIHIFGQWSQQIKMMKNELKLEFFFYNEIPNLIERYHKVIESKGKYFNDRTTDAINLYE